MAGNPYLWSTTALTNASVDADINFAEGQLPGTVNNSARGLMAGIAGWLLDTNGSTATTGSANAYAFTSNVAYAALATGLRLVVRANFTNTAAATFNLTPSGGAAFGAKAIKIIRVSGEGDPAANEIRANGHYILEYDATANGAAGAWILLNPSPSNITDGSRLNGFLGNPNTATTYDISADLAVLRDSTGTTVAYSNTGVKTVNLGGGGPAANARDQAGAFSANSWVHLYFIGGVGVAIASLASATAPPTGPTLPTGYTHWAYAGALRFNGSSNIVNVYMRGSVADYQAAQALFSNSTAVVESAFSVASFVPPNALSFKLYAQYLQVSPSGGSAIAYASIRVLSGSDYQTRFPYFAIQGGLTSTTGVSGGELWVPNGGQNFYYLITVVTGTTPQYTVDLLSYKMPNGGE